MSWKRVKKGVSTLLAVLSVAAGSAKKFEVFSGLILSRPIGTNRMIRPFCF
jgi:hypothetical protein